MNCFLFVILNLLEKSSSEALDRFYLRKILTLKSFTFLYFAKLVRNKVKLKSCDDTTMPIRVPELLRGCLSEIRPIIFASKKKVCLKLWQLKEFTEARLKTDLS